MSFTLLNLKLLYILSCMYRLINDLNLQRIPKNLTSKPQTTTAIAVHLQSQCSIYDRKPYQHSDLYGPFKVNSVKECWSYCKLEGNCKHFSFHFLTSKCHLFKEFFPSNITLRHLNTITVDLHCSECLGELKDVVEAASTSKVLIKHQFTFKCLVVRYVKTQLNETRSGFQLVWKSCKNASLWLFHKSKHVYTLWGDQRTLVSISSDVGSNLALEWRPIVVSETLKFTEIFITERTNSSNQLFLLYDGLSVDKDCVFELAGPHFKAGTMEGDHFKHLFVGSFGVRNGLNKILIQLPAPSKENTCTIKQYKVNSSQVLNVNAVPYFLPGSLVTVKCKSGYGVGEMNFTSQQVVECGAGVPPRSCSLIMLHKRDEVLCQVYLVAVITLSSVIVTFIAQITCTALVKHYSRRGKVGEKGEVPLEVIDIKETEAATPTES